GGVQRAAWQGAKGLRRGGPGMSKPRVRGRTMVLLSAGAAALRLGLLARGVVPGVRNTRELAQAAERLRTTPPNVYVIRPESASVASLTMAATTQATQDRTI